ncbi:putative N-acetylglucosaminyl-phosphatidylinositol de-N-acetylase [Hypsizygus marmoreus]|uniref:N-acetylglucosaminylphosphatidylinositol deacetylase n=1 Tax=Hypsizygus marmoreus TaxID=39966 RepID=A0A369K1H1_HYPMA|nr:putative N-acetylglucosaminyl-phosphatidylinositol de-N-acetylase [Hypsizygus marmoreus]
MASSSNKSKYHALPSRMFKFFPWTALLFSLIIAILYQSVESDNSFSDIVFHSSAHLPRVLVLTAHPDDESMFFAPTIRALVSRIRTNRIPMSKPASDPVRLSSETTLTSKITYTAHWSPATIPKVLYPYVNEHRITTILTFDDGGISGHPNHKSLPEGIRHLLSHQRYAFAAPPPKLFTLVTRSIPAKYTSILAPIWSKFTLYGIRLLSLEVLAVRIARGLGIELSPLISKPVTHRMPQVLVSGVSDYLAALRAMRQHASQLVWFRWLYVLFSRYMWVNEWVEVPVESLSV